jgi:hypothetical protein
MKGPEGIVLAADSRVTLMATPAPGQPGQPLSVNFDNATKLLTFKEPHTYVGVVTYGQAAIGLRTAQSFVPEFEVLLPTDRISIEDFTTLLCDFFRKQWVAASMPNDPDMHFLVAGFDENQPYGRVFEITVASGNKPKEWWAGTTFGIIWGGQKEYAERLVNGYDPNLIEIVKTTLNLSDSDTQKLAQALAVLNLSVPYQFLPLQDCVDFAIYLIRSTIGAQALSVTLRGVGGPIDVATITSHEGLKLVQMKQITGEIGL